MKQYTAHFHDGTMEGDCVDVSIKIDSPDITWAKIKKKLLSAEGAKLGWQVTDEEGIADFIECHEDVKGCWIVDPETQEKFELAAKNMEPPGGDSACYAQQEAWKGFYSAFAVKTLGQKATS